MIKIFHMGDVHLDSAFHRFPKEQRVKLRAHQRKLFLKMIDHVRQGGYDMLLISGDLFDGIDVSVECEECVISALSSLACPVVISPGNHDPFELISTYRKQKLSENVYVFSSYEPQVFDFPEIGVQVCGYAFLRSNELSYDPLEGFTPPEFDGVRLLCAHGELGVSGSKFAPLYEAEIAAKGFKYAALGHVHTPSVTEKDGAVIAYCGVSEGRGFDECGIGGALSVVIDGDRVTTERVEFGEYEYKVVSFDVSGISDAAELLKTLAGLVDATEKKDTSALRIELSGEADISLEINCEDLAAALSDRIFYLEIKDKTYPKIDTSALSLDSTLRGEIYRVLGAALESESPEERKKAAEALRIALLAVEGREIG
ncbi:MAG: DNA repair exonuclease [Clostridia bacterium]|nr:DNA repair exonuclease [Clostridia bacterium]